MSALPLTEIYGTIAEVGGPAIQVKPKRRNPRMARTGNEATRFQPGQSGNPDGRPKNAGLSVREWYNALATCTPAEWKRIANDKNCTGARRAAARRWLDADNADHRQLAGSALDAICEQTAGKPVQPIEMSGPDGGPIQSQVSFDFSGFASMFASQANEAPRPLAIGTQPMLDQPVPQGMIGDAVHTAQGGAADIQPLQTNPQTDVQATLAAQGMVDGGQMAGIGFTPSVGLDKQTATALASLAPNVAG
jgi:hypothetical protein